MNYKDLFNNPNEKPLDNLVDDGGFCRIFRTLGCIGDSLSSGEFTGCNDEGTHTFHDMYEYSWGQYIARNSGIQVYNFSKGGMTARGYHTFAENHGYWSYDILCQAYIIALGVNDIMCLHEEVGSIKDIDLENYENNKDTFAGNYAKIIQRLKKMQPKARFFLVSMPTMQNGPQSAEMTKLLYDFAEIFEYTYVLDFEKYAPVYDSDFKDKFFLSGHMNPMGYILTAKMIESYIDYIIRHNIDDFRQVPFIGKPYHNTEYKW